MSPKSGKAVTLVAPLQPESAAEASVADPGSVDAPPPAAPSSRPPHKLPLTQMERIARNSWIEIEMVDEQGHPVPSKRYRVILPDGSAAEGALDGDGRARVEGFEKGDCKITFPDLDSEAWEPA